MAEPTVQDKNFQKTLEKISDASKKPGEGRSERALAVQIVDKSGKVEGGTREIEKEREKLQREKKHLSLLQAIASGITKDKLTATSEKKGLGGLGGMLKTLLAALIPAGMLGLLGGASLLGKLGIGALALAGIWSAVDAIGDGLLGIKWAKEMKMEKESGFIAGFFGGSLEGGLLNAFTQGLKGAAIGATIGFAGGPVGIVVGAILGAALFGIAGFFGAEKIMEWINPLIKKFKRLFGLSVEIDPKEMKKIEEDIKKTEKIESSLSEQLKTLQDRKNKALSAAVVDQDLVDGITIKIADISTKILTVSKKSEKLHTKRLVIERDTEKNALNAAEEAVAANKKEMMHLNNQRRKFEAQVTRYDADTKEGQVAAANLEATRAKLRLTRKEGQKLRDAEEKAAAVLLAEDRRLIKKAQDEGGKASWRSHLNVFFTDLPKFMSDLFKPMTEWFDKKFTETKEFVVKIKGKVFDAGEWIGEVIGKLLTRIKEFLWVGDGSGLLEFDLKAMLKMPEINFSGIEEMFANMLSSLSPSRIFGLIGQKIEPMPFDFWFGEDVKKVLLKIFDPALAVVSEASKAAAFGGMKMATGGTFTGKTPIMVGELGPELIFPSGGGTVIPADQTKNMLQGDEATHMLGRELQQMNLALEAIHNINLRHLELATQTPPTMLPINNSVNIGSMGATTYDASGGSNRQRVITS